jgi:hypothetical protein
MLDTIGVIDVEDLGFVYSEDSYDWGRRGFENLPLPNTNLYQNHLQQ